MRTIGLVGGISWSSTMDYYRLLNEAVNQKLGGLHFAECIVYSVDFDRFCRYNAAHAWDKTFELLLDPARRLQQAGAQLLMLGANTAHKVAERIQARIDIPLIDIRVATADAIRKQGLKKVGLLGTIFTMEMDFYRHVLHARDIETIVPASQQQRDYIEDTLLHELGKGIIRPATRQQYLRIIHELVDNGAEGIVLGCTEIPLLISQRDLDIPVFNSTQLHVQAAVEHAFATY